MEVHANMWLRQDFNLSLHFMAGIWKIARTGTIQNFLKIILPFICQFGHSAHSVKGR